MDGDLTEMPEANGFVAGVRTKGIGGLAFQHQGAEVHFGIAEA